MATPIAVAVREALFTRSGRTRLISRGVQPSLLCTASVYVARLGSFLSCCSFLDLYRNALAKACPFNLGSLRGGRAPGRGEPEFRGGLCPGLCCFLLLVCDPGSSSSSLFHLQKGPRPNS